MSPLTADDVRRLQAALRVDPDTAPGPHNDAIQRLKGAFPELARGAEQMTTDQGELIAVEDMNGTEAEVLFVDSFEVADKTYAILRLMSEDGQPGRERIYRVELDEANEESFAAIEDPDELAAAAAEWDAIQADHPTCRVCGCTDDKACEGGCYWVAPCLCSKCSNIGHVGQAAIGEDQSF
jgi:hypothetical protein